MTPANKPDEASAVDPIAVDMEEELLRGSSPHASDCSIHNAPAYEPGKCDCGADPIAIDLGFVVKQSDTDNRVTLKILISRLIAAVEALREKADNAWNEAWDLAHEPARCGHVRANYKDPKFGTPEYKGKEKCEVCAEVEALRERVAELELFTGHLRASRDHAAQSSEAAEARVVELAGVLKELLREHECLLISIGNANARVSIWHKKARTVLVATPAKVLERARTVEWQSIEESNPPRHETVLFLCSNGDIYQGRGCYGMHVSWWCGHGVLNFGKILSDEGLTVTHWKPKGVLALGKEET